MDLLKDDIKKIYFKYLLSAFGSALIVSIYSIVDMAVVGQYQGAEGTAALAVVAPIWNIIYSLGLFMGVGGSVIFSSIKGDKNSDQKEANQYFTISLIGATILSIVTTILIFAFEKQILTFFGATNDTLLYLSQDYLKTIRFAVPLFLFNQFLASYLRNDNNPLLATIGVLSGGLFNVFGDIFFTFTLNMGIFGAGLATTIGSIVSFLIMIIHFFTKRNTLKLTKFDHFFLKLGRITQSGFSTFIVDAAMGILTILFNRQIMKYLNQDALSIYGTIITISTFVQCCAYSVGQAAQPIISINYGAKNSNRIKETLKCAMISAIFFALLWTILSLSAPNIYIYIFIKPTDNILSIAPFIIRIYSLSFLLLPINVFSTYYFQSILKPNIALIISIMRGILFSGALIMLLPLIDSNAIWFAMPITELLTFIFVITCLILSIKKLPNNIEARKE